METATPINPTPISPMANLAPHTAILTWTASRSHVRWKVDANHQRQKRCRHGCWAPLAAAAAAGAVMAGNGSGELCSTSLRVCCKRGGAWSGTQERTGECPAAAARRLSLLRATMRCG